jgi:flagellar basal body rod protein FlgF
MNQSRYILIFLFVFFSTIKADLYDTHFNNLPDNGIRELATAADAWQQQYFKGVEYTINVGTPGYIKKDYKHIRIYNEDTGGHEVSTVMKRKWLDGQPVETNRPLDFALASLQDGGHHAFFIVELPQGVMAFTKDGRFRVDYSGRLVSLSGNFPVIGEDGHIFVPEGADITSSRSGRLYNGATTFDKFKVVVFDTENDLNKLTGINGVFFVLKGEAKFRDGPDAYKVMQGWITQSNSFLSHDKWMVTKSYTYVYSSLYKLIDVDKKIYTSMSPEQ